MALLRGTISDLARGLSQLPPIQRLPGELAEAENVLCSIARGIYRRPGTEVLATLPVDITGSVGIWTFPIGTNVYQIVLMEKVDTETGSWYIGWVDIDTKDFLRDTSDNFITPEGDVFDGPLITGESNYLGLPDDISPQEGFRAQKHEGKIYLLNRTKTVRLLTTTAPDNSIHTNKWLIYFPALTSGADVTVTLSWMYQSMARSSTLTETDASIETIAERLLVTGADDDPVVLPAGVVTHSALRQVMALTFAAGVTDFRVQASNIVALPFQGNTGGGESTPLPSVEARPTSAPDQWRVKVIGDPVSDLDDLYLVFRAQGEDS